MQHLLYGYHQFVHDEAAVTSMEYALLGALIVTVCAATVGTLGGTVLALYTDNCKAISTAVSGAAAC